MKRKLIHECMYSKEGVPLYHTLCVLTNKEYLGIQHYCTVLKNPRCTNPHKQRDCQVFWEMEYIGDKVNDDCNYLVAEVRWMHPDAFSGSGNIKFVDHEINLQIWPLLLN